MRDQYSKKILASGAVGFFLSGLVAGGLLTRAFFFPAPPPTPLSVPAQLEEAHRLLDKGLLTDAEKSYLAVLGRDPVNPEALTHLGNVAFQQGDVERALRFYDTALRQDGSYAHALWDQGTALRAKGDDAGAIKAWEAFARLFPADSSDVVQVKKWIAEARARLGSASNKPGETPKKLLLEKPPKALMEGQSSR